MIAKMIRFCLGLFFVPVVMGYTLAFSDQLLEIHHVHAPEVVFLLGVTAYLAFHALVAAPTRAYVFGHELMHAAATWISGGQVKGFKAGSKKGSVKTNKVTAFIALAPYLVPVYAILWALVYGVASLFWDVKPWIGWFFFGLGMALTFHLVFTVTALKQKQSDLEITGPILALGIITWANITFVAGVLSLFVPEVRLMTYLVDGLHHTEAVYRMIFHQLFGV